MPRLTECGPSALSVRLGASICGSDSVEGGWSWGDACCTDVLLQCENKMRVSCRVTAEQKGYICPTFRTNAASKG